MQELSTVWWMCNAESQQIIWGWKWGHLHLCLILKVHCGLIHVRNLVEKHHKETVCMTLASCSCSWCHSRGRLKTPRYFLCLETSCHYIQSTLVIHVHYRGTLYWRLWKNLCLQVVKMENSPRKCEIVNYAVHSDSLGVCKMQCQSYQWSMYENVATAVLFTGGNGDNCMHIMMQKIQQTLYFCRNTDIGSQCAWP